MSIMVEQQSEVIDNIETTAASAEKDMEAGYVVTLLHLTISNVTLQSWPHRQGHLLCSCRKKKAMDLLHSNTHHPSHCCHRSCSCYH